MIGVFVLIFAFLSLVFLCVFYEQGFDYTRLTIGENEMILDCHDLHSQVSQ